MSCEIVYKWPCSYQGSEKYFGINLASFLAKEGETLSGVVWTIPNGLTLMDERIEFNVAYIKLSLDYTGQYKIPVTIFSVEGNTTQATKEVIHLEVDSIV